MWRFAISPFHDALVLCFRAIILHMVIQQEFPGKLLEAQAAGEILLLRMQQNVMSFRLGRFEEFLTEFASTK